METPSVGSVKAGLRSTPELITLTGLVTTLVDGCPPGPPTPVDVVAPLVPLGQTTEVLLQPGGPVLILGSPPRL